MTKAAKGTKDRTAALEDQLKQRDARIGELRADLDRAEALTSELREQVEDADAAIESWIEAFDMVQNENGAWTYAPWIDRFDKLHADHLALVRDWNKHVATFNATVAPRAVGRPLAASEAQVVAVLKLRKAGASLRAIADETSLGLPTVRTIVDRRGGRDRTTVKHLARIDPDRKLEASWRARKRVRDALPKRITATLERGRELVKQAKGLK